MKTYYQTPPPNHPTNPDLLTRACGIVANLPTEWTVVPGYNHIAIFEEKDTGLRITIRRPDRGKAYEISQDHQQGPNGYRYFGSYTRQTPSINCSTARSAHAIAADVARRLLPQARQHFTAETAQIQQWYAEEQRKADAMQLLIQVGNGNQGSFDDCVYGQKWKARVYFDRVDLTLSNLDAETACAVLELIR